MSGSIGSVWSFFLGWGKLQFDKFGSAKFYRGSVQKVQFGQSFPLGGRFRRFGSVELFFGVGIQSNFGWDGEGVRLGQISFGGRVRFDLFGSVKFWGRGGVRWFGSTGSA